MKYRVGACALLIGLAGCSGDNPAARFAASADSVAQPPKLGMSLPGLPSRPAQGSIASAPDLGALISYKNKGVPAKQEGAYTWYPVAVSEEHAIKALMTGEMTVPAPDGTQVRLRYERHEEQADGNWTWVGRVEGGDQRQEAILTFGQDAVFGSIPQPNGAAPLSLQTRAGSLFAVVTDRSKVVSPNTRATDVMIPQAMALRASLAPAIQKAVAQKAITANAPPSSANTIDLAIGYTPGMASVYGGDSAAVTRLSYLVVVGNQAFTNSQINGYLRLVKAVKIDFADNTDNEAALGQLTGHNGNSAVTVPAALVPLRTARDEFGADLAVLVRRFQTPENNGCGIAWLNGADQTPINPALDDDYGFAVISDGSDVGIDGKTYFCAEETLVHELGHLMGSAHDRDNSKTSSGALQYGRYPYSFGMKTDASNGNFYTIMAYGDNLQNFYRTFSNPLVILCGPNNNLACGVADQTDNARSLNQTIPVVAAFRATIVGFPGTALTPELIGSRANDVNGDGRSDILWGMDAGGNWAYWTMSGGAKTGGVGYAVGADWKVVATGDFRGDGKLDLVWSNGFQMQLWDGTGNGFVGFPMPSYPGGYSLAGVGDINADGKDDLIWRDDASTTVGIWLMNGQAVVGSAAYAVGPAWRILGTGDLNGDNRLDLIWTDGFNMQLWAGLPSGGFSGVAMPNYPVGWTLIGIGDVGGDGLDDLLWRFSTGEVAYWRMSGGTKLSGTSFASSTAWKPLQVGDYNGDGKADILWTDGSLMQMWLSQGASFAGASAPAYPITWSVIRR